MRKLIESTFVSLDGDISQGLLAWAPPYWDDEHNDYATKLLSRADALVLGRETYDGFSSSWPQRDGDGDPYTDRINAMPKYVASRTLTETTWNTTLLEGDAVDAVARLKEEPGQDLLKFGTGAFSQALFGRGLVDELHLWRFPVIAGTSDNIFDGLDVTHLDVIDLVRFRSGIVVEVYAPRTA